MTDLFASQIQIFDFMDYNHVNIAFDITVVDRELLRQKLHSDYVNHLNRLEDANYIAFWNCDLQGFKAEDDIYFITGEDCYTLAKLIYVDGKWVYEVINSDARVREDLLF